MESHKDQDGPEIPDVCMSCEVRHGGICHSMSAHQLAEMNRIGRRRTIEPGVEVHSQGEPMRAYANIMSGVVKLTKVMADGRQQIVGLQFPSDFVGQPFSEESSLSAVAAIDTEICAVPKAAMDRLVSSTPALERHLHGRAQLELDEAREWMLALGRKSAREKVASFLHRIATRQDLAGPGVLRFELPLTRREIGDFLGLTIETVSRQMTKLRQDRLIDVEGGRHVAILDQRRLKREAGIVD